MHRMHHSFLAKVGLTLAALALFGPPAPALGDLIRPDAAQAFPDLSGDIVGTQTYDFDPATNTGTFQVKNTPTLLAVGPQASSESFVTDSAATVRSQTLQVKLGADGHLVTDSANSFSVYGSVVVDGKSYDGLLLQGTPTAFGFANPNPQAPSMSVYDLNMSLTGGLLMDAYGPDAYLRIIAETNSNFTGAFTQDFTGLKALTNVRAYNSPNPSPIPEPSTFAILLAFGGAGLAFKHRRRVSLRELLGPAGEDD